MPPTGRRDSLDLVWLVVPAAVGIFLLRTVLIARRLKLAAGHPTESDARALREAKRGLQAHREHLRDAVASPARHFEAAKQLSRMPSPRARPPATGLDAMVEDFLPDRRF